MPPTHTGVRCLRSLSHSPRATRDSLAQACGFVSASEDVGSPELTFLCVAEADRHDPQWLSCAATMLHLLGDVVDATCHLRDVIDGNPVLLRTGWHMNHDAQASQSDCKGSEGDTGGDGVNDGANGHATRDDARAPDARQQIARLQELQTAAQRLTEACAAAGVQPPSVLADAHARVAQLSAGRGTGETSAVGTGKERSIQRLIEMGYDAVGHLFPSSVSLCHTRAYSTAL